MILSNIKIKVGSKNQKVKVRIRLRTIYGGKVYAFSLSVAHTLLFVISVVFKRNLAGNGGFAVNNEKHENKEAKLTWIVGGCLIVLLLVFTTAIKSICDSKTKQSRVEAEKQKQEDEAAK